MSPHLEPVGEPAPEVAELLAGMPSARGVPLNVFRTLAHHPRLLKRMNVFGGLFLAHGSLPDRQREIVILRAAWRARSIYEFGQHTLLGREAGLTEVEIGALAGGRHDWSAEDQALISAADQVDAAARVDLPTWEALVETHGSATAIEVVFLAGFYRMLAGFLNTVEVELDPGVPGWPAST
jgi:4-carboxymuconolactone decarboxylase